VVELMDSQTGPVDRKLNNQITWDGWKSSELRIDADEKIRLRDSMLEDLPSGDESQASRMDLIYSLASFQWAKGNFENSLKLLNDGLTIASALADRIAESQFLAGIGTVNHSKSSTKEAVSFYEQSVEKNPYNSYAWNNLAIAYFETGNNDKAVQVCKRSIENKSKNTMAYSILGDLYRQMGRLEDAKDCIAVTTKLEPKVALHWINLGDIYFVQHRDKEALRAYLKASRLSQDDPEVWKRLGKVYLNSKRTKEARKAFNNALALSPDDMEIATLLENLELQD
jgi:tetratricopeptide (TPR) repeat protein